MVLSIIKILLFFVMVAGAAFGADAILKLSGIVRISAFGQEITVEPIVVLIVIFVLFVVFWLLLKLIGLSIAVVKFVNGDETAISRFFNKSRERRGFAALSEGMLALASGDAQSAMGHAAKAQKYLNNQEVTGILAAQAAEQSGDTAKAEDAYKRLLGHERTRFVGLHGILKQRLAQGETETALKLAEKAFALRPRHELTQDALLSLQAAEEDWDGVLKTLSAKLKHGAIPRDLHTRRVAVITLQKAREARTAGMLEDAQTLAIEANRLSPTLVPGAAMAARALVEQDNPRKAIRVLKAAWQNAPHPELASEFAAISPDEDPQERIKRFGALTRIHPDHAETQMLLAELHIAAEDFPEARKALADLPQSDPTARSLSLLATIARGEGATDQVVRNLLTKAISASSDPTWVCSACRHAHRQWQAACEDCHGIDTLAWERPSKDERGSRDGVLPKTNPILLD